MKKTPKVYIAGPYRAETTEQVDKNIESARRAGLVAVKRGWNALTPHLLFAGMDRAAPAINDDVWLSLTMEWLRECDAVYLVDGWQGSAGTLAEIKEAKRLGLPIYRLDELPLSDYFLFNRAAGASGGLLRDRTEASQKERAAQAAKQQAALARTLARSIARTAQSLSLYRVGAGEADRRGTLLLLKHLKDLQEIELERARVGLEIAPVVLGSAAYLAT